MLKLRIPPAPAGLRVGAWAPIAAGAASGAALTALTPSIMPRSSTDQKLLAGGGAAMGALAGASALVAQRVFKGPMGSYYNASRVAVTGAALLGTAGIVATHWGPSVATLPSRQSFDPRDMQVIGSLEEQRAQPAKPGTSEVGRAKMDYQGLRFLDTVLTDQPEQAVRVYAGLDSAQSAEERVEFAIERMHEMGAFQKSRILIAQPSGSGFVNQVPIQAAEQLAKGDIATVAAQYGNMRSLTVDSYRNVGFAAEQHRMLLAAVHREIMKLPADERPEVYMFGESLGGWTAQMAVLDQGFGSFDELGVKRALWVGTPGLSDWDQQVPETRTVRLNGVDELADAQASDVTSATRVVEFLNSNDPVNKLDWSVAWKRPAHLGGDGAPADGERPGGVPDGQVWLPGVTLLQTLIDTKNAIAGAQAGQFDATAHDYRMAHAKSVQLALGFDDVPASELEDMTRKFEQLERDYFATHPSQP